MSEKIIIGVDPDSNKHGVAIYSGGKLTALNMWQLIDFYTFITQSIYDGFVVEIHMEDVCANNGIFRTGNSQKVQQSIARRLGMVQQSQLELERIFEHIGKNVKVVKHKISKNWKSSSQKKQFETYTGWKGRSNEDSRSAAWFGFCGLS